MIDFLGIGVQKAGTTLLYEHLKDVREVFVPKVKEIHFFDIDKNFLKGKEWYYSFFKEADSGQIKGEITPAYIYFKKVPYRVKSLLNNEDLKFIVILRNPVYRAWSHYWMEFNRGKESLSFEHAIIKELLYKLRSCEEHHVLSYIDRGFYSNQIMNWFKFFPRKNFMFLIFEKFVKDQNFYMNEILKFLDIHKVYNFQNALSRKSDL